ncbi:MAG: hypothetical protein WKG01_10585 [Kofleriaceae bacterium]
MAHIDPAQAGHTQSSPGAVTDLLATFAPLIPLALSFLDGGDSYRSLKGDLRGLVNDDPADALLATVIGGGLAFYLAERQTNPACQNPWDGILYAATCLSVGYDNLFPSTTTGHAIAAAIQTFGPALATKALDPPAAELRAVRAEEAAVDRAILARLEDIVRLLEAKH